MALLSVVLAVTVTVVLTVAVFAAFRQILRNRELTEAHLAEVKEGFYQVGQNVTTVAQMVGSFQMGTWWLRYALVGGYGDIDISGSVDIKSEPTVGQANIYAAGKVKMSGSPTIEGDVTAVGSIDMSGASVVTGTVRPNFPWPLVFPTDAQITAIAQQYLAEAQAGGNFTGDKLYSGSGTHELGPLHITGEFQAQDSVKIKLTGTVYVDGDITMSGSARIEGPGTIVSGGTVVATGFGRLPLEDIPIIMSVNNGITSGGTNEMSALLFAPRGTIRFTPGASFYGAAFGSDLDIAGPPRLVLTYPFTPR